jgi:8-oxo-dGTP pyrophosphatase MutT (NUDIX family)
MSEHLLRQFTATVYIIAEEKVLLIYHRKLAKWLPAGGHLEPNELPPEGAKREALEETGLEIELMSHENLWIERDNAKSFERPFMCLLENVPARPEQPAHQHIDLIYVGRPIGGKELQNLDETGGMKWFSLDDVETMESDVEMFEETKEAIRKIFSIFFTSKSFV